jgi:hypothetical protein
MLTSLFNTASTMPYRIQITHYHSGHEFHKEMLPNAFDNLDGANLAARDLAEIEFCIPNAEAARCRMMGPGVLEEWTVGDAWDGSHVRISVRVIWV